tara:strand:+ start:2965 stop:3498 length:534 start_codon:yes stop_codon:yes gene_type:complete
MKKNVNVSIYDTTNTEATAALLALGFPLINTDPIRRIFTEKRPANNQVSFGLKRGGEVEYRLEASSDQHDEKAGVVAQAYWDKEAETHSEEFDEKLINLRKKLQGTEGGILFEEILREYPQEVARYIRVAFDQRRQLIKQVINRQDMVELVRIEKEDGHNVLHHVNCPAEKVAKLLE